MCLIKRKSDIEKVDLILVGDIKTKHFRYNRVSFFRTLRCVQITLITNYYRIDLSREKVLLGKGFWKSLSQNILVTFCSFLQLTPRLLNGICKK